MTYQEKAQELVQKHMNVGIEYSSIAFPPAVEAALITARELFNSMPHIPSDKQMRESSTSQASRYWANVIAELEKMKSNQ